MSTFPIDTTKTRLQVQGEITGNAVAKFKGGTYRGMFHAFHMISKYEGVMTLYKGLSAAILRQTVYGTIKIGLYNRFKHEVLGINVLCAMTAAVISSAIASPTDLLKVGLHLVRSFINIRMQAHSGSENTTFLTSARELIAKEGITALYKGVLTTATRSAIVCGVELPIYDFIKKHSILSGLLDDNKLCHFFSSFSAGLMGAIASNPIDVAR
ncbi:unnamed protein product, partial [Protopolystoma xenopodis]